MPILKSFSIKNFKGIASMDLDISRRNSCPVITLIGLNESGKTTILEALSHFVTNDRDVAGLFDAQKNSEFAESYTYPSEGRI